ncbi:uncharacterized protein LOC126906827 [Daktulosphaira vitifoliae]|uniref:uncharacterized protein LOC126906827 n=1 Tax=Daktulosphaira vitifoliae TaxID=58002 RepID=UPI0021AAA7CD|nr:uncharacterized protein LOC126906827 [Daktulosphaira vitifoliae]
MNYSSIFIFFLLSLATNGQPKQKEKSKWNILSWQEGGVYDHLSKCWIFLYQLLFKKNNCCQDYIVSKKNVNQKLREIMLLINHEYTISLVWIVNHIRHIAVNCIWKKMWYPLEDHTHCVNLLLPNIENSKKLIIRFISAINFLMKLLNIKTNPFILDELIKFVGVISREINENDNSYVDKIERIFKEEYEGNNCKLNNIVRDYCINRRYTSVIYIDFDLDNYKKKNHLPNTFEMYEFVEVTLRNGIQDKEKTLYTNLGFFYDKLKNETTYVHELVIVKRKKKLFCL